MCSACTYVHMCMPPLPPPPNVDQLVDEDTARLTVRVVVLPLVVDKDTLDLLVVDLLQKVLVFTSPCVLDSYVKELLCVLVGHPLYHSLVKPSTMSMKSSCLRPPTISSSMKSISESISFSTQWR